MLPERRTFRCRNEHRVDGVSDSLFDGLSDMLDQLCESIILRHSLSITRQALDATLMPTSHERLWRCLKNDWNMGVTQTFHRHNASLQSNEKQTFQRPVSGIFSLVRPPNGMVHRNASAWRLWHPKSLIYECFSILIYSMSCHAKVSREKGMQISFIHRHFPNISCELVGCGH